MKLSCGILMYYDQPDHRTYLLVRPGGPFFRNREKGIWTIPKGLINSGEAEEDAARREFKEETGQDPIGPLQPLGKIKLNKSKEVVAFAMKGFFEAQLIRSNTFELEYPRKSGIFRSFPEIERGKWCTLSDARELLHPKLLTFVEMLEAEYRAAN